MPRLLVTRLVALLGAVASTSACTIPTTPLSNNIPEGFSIVVQNPAIPVVHNGIMNFRANGDDEHLVLRPDGVVTNDALFLVNGRLNTRNIHAVIDLEYDDHDDTTKMFMTAREYHPAALFQPVYGCDPDTDELQIRLQLVSRELTPPVLGGQLGIRLTVGTYEFRYSPPNNPLLDRFFLPVNLVVFRDGNAPTATPTATPTPTLPPTLPPITTTVGPVPTPPTISDYDYVSCWAEPDGGRTLTSVTTVADLTNQKCAALCAGSAYFGTQWHVECWCGPALGAGSAAAPEGQCVDTCGGDTTQFCGGGRRLSLYKKKATTSSSLTSVVVPPVSSSTTTVATTLSTSTTSSTTTTTTTTSTTTTSASQTPSNPAGLPSIGKFDFVSCWAEPDGGRTLPALFTAAADMTLQKCAAICTNYAYFGTQYSEECFCDNTLGAGSVAAPLADCSSNCIGNPLQKCGGGRRLSLYHNAAYVGPAQPGVIGGYTFEGCRTDSVAVRTLTAKTFASDTLTLQTCATFCAGYTYFGTEYARECFCGNVLAAGSTTVATGQCSKPCSGNAAQLCGEGDRLSLYKLAPPV